MLDRYELLCAIAQGGMAAVWLARFRGKHGFEKLVAIKTILPEHALDDSFRKMFLDEARIASGIDHPNVAKILDLGEWRDFLYLTMEYVNGDPLSRTRRMLTKQGVKMPPSISLRILADACAGLHAAHELRGADGELVNVVHRDVSPQNVLVPENGCAKLIDFGVAKARDRLGGETGGALTKGKSRYMSPEQALGHPIDRRADVFAVGAMAYEIFEGAAPYEGPNDFARLHALMTGAQVTEVRASPNEAVEALIVKALARNPEERFATALELRDALDDAITKIGRATTDDVAAYFAKHTADRLAERKRIVKLAIDGANERERIREELEKSSLGSRKRLDTSGDEIDSGLIEVPPSIPAMKAAAPPPPLQANAAPPPPPPPSAAEPPPAAAEPILTPGVTSVQGYTASVPDVDADAPRDAAPPPSRKRGIVALAVATGVALTIGVAAVVARSVGAEHAPAPVAAANVQPVAASASASSETPATSATQVTTTMTPAPTTTTTTTAVAATKPTATAATKPTGATKAKPPGAGKKTKSTDVVIQ